MTVIPVVTAEQAAERDRATIASGVPSRALMQRAGAASAGEIVRRFPDGVQRGVAIYAGAGNNGGDAWVVARALHGAGLPVRVFEVEPPRTEDARAERALALAGAAFDVPRSGEGVVVDGVLGTGARGAPRGAVADAVARMTRARADGARIAALDVPTGLDADTGGTDSLIADLTLTFGAPKRGMLAARDRCGTIVVLDIGLGPSGANVPALAEEAWVLARVPGFAASAHKGDRCRIAIVGGASGMAGAVILAGRAALRAGAGLVRIAAADASVAAIQSAVPEALADAWPGATGGDVVPASWAHAVAIGPGLGATPASRELVERAVTSAIVPILLDADALNVFAGSIEALASLLNGHRAVLTPHPAEMARLMGIETAEVLARRWTIGADVALRTGAVVLLKGVPTIVSAPDGRIAVVARGTPALATGGSGDLLSGVAATLLAQMDDPFEAAACAAWAHGRAAELTHEGRSPRGVVVGNVIEALGQVWDRSPSLPVYPVLAELPAIPA